MSVKTAAKVEYCEITWGIKNFSVGPWKENAGIDSHEFAVCSTSTVKWYLQFYPNESLFGKHFASLYLHRSSTDAGPESVRVRFKCSILTGSTSVGYKTFWEDENECSFKKNEKFGFKNISTLERILGMHGTKVLIEDSLLVCCEILIKPAKVEGERKALELEPGQGLLPCPGQFDISLLSKDLKAFYEKKKLCDLSWSVEGRDVEVHKAMLVSRSPVFHALLNDETSSSESIDLADIEYDAVDAFFSFLYSGDFSDILDKPLFGLYQCAKKFSVTDLKQITIPDKICCITRIQSEECEFTWVIENFSKLKTSIDECISSPPLNKLTSKTAVWQLKIYPKGKSATPDDVGVFAEVKEGNKSLYVSLQISLLDSAGTVKYTMRTVTSTSAEGITGFPSFIRTKILRRDKRIFLSSDTLRVHCSIKFSSGNCESKLDGHKLSCVTVGCPGNSYVNLSRHLTSLYESGKYSDVSLVAGQRKFEAHRFVLAARSSVFECMFEHDMQEKEIGVVKIPDVDANIVEIMLKYIYSGNICDLSPDTALGLYPAAEKYDLQYLRDICSTFLQTNLQVDNVCSVLALAALYDDEKLKKEAMKFVCSNAHKIFFREEWKALENERQDLTLQVFESLSKGYRNALSTADVKK